MKKILIILMLFTTIIFPLQANAEITQDINDFKEFDSFMKRYHEHTSDLAYFISTSYNSNEHYFKENFDIFRNAVNSVYDTNKSEFWSKYMDKSEELFSKPIALLATADDLRALIFDKIKSFFGKDEINSDLLDVGSVSGNLFTLRAPEGYVYNVSGFTEDFRSITALLHKDGGYFNVNGYMTVGYQTLTYFDKFNTSQTNIPIYDEFVQKIRSGIATNYDFYKIWYAFGNPSIILKSIETNEIIPTKSPVYPQEIVNNFNRIINNFDSESKFDKNYTPTVAPVMICPAGKIPLTYENGVFKTNEELVITLQNETAVIGNETCNLDFEFPQITFDETTGEIFVDEQSLVASPIGDYPECDGILCFVSNIFGIIKDLIKAIVGIPMAILNGLIDTIKFLFVPSAESFQNFFTELNTMMTEKFNITAFTNVFNDLQQAQGGGTFEGVKVVGLMGTGEVQIIDGSTINAMLPTLHSWIRGIFYILLVFFNVNHLYKLIRGTTIFESMRGGKES